uniref:NADP-dependent oxidoreductase domain-containing protein n=1 Tax=Podarcis muralis TaxID=64176 RepID=A0A670KHI3_PODMU
MALSKDRGITMNDGNKIPILGFGTYPPDAEATKTAIEFGFRHIDGAYVYQSEEQVGRAVRAKISDGTVKREDIFYTGKVSEFGNFFFKK